MERDVEYSPRERFCLWLFALFTLFVINGAFLYGTFLHPTALRDTLSNPIALAFIAEAMLLVVALAYLLPKWGVTRISRAWFVALAIVGGLGFAIPVALLGARRRKD